MRTVPQAARCAHESHMPTSSTRTPLPRDCAQRPAAPPTPAAGAAPCSRRHHLVLLSAVPAALAAPLSAWAAPESPADTSTPPSPPTPAPTGIPDYSGPGPFQAVRLPNLEHTCTTCDAPAERCRLKIHAWLPKGTGRLGLPSPFPLAIITPGFLIAADQYVAYAERLASWGYAVIAYDRTQAALDPVSDVVCVEFLRDLIDWARTSAPLGPLCDTNAVYLVGHSRGGKVSTLAAAADPRVQALFLIDPVDVTVYAPLSPEFPSAVAALEGLGAAGRSLPLAVVGSGRGGDCVPTASNYARFFEASDAPAWEGVVADAGHLQFLGSRTGNAMDLVCAAGKIPDVAVGDVTAAMMVAWGEVMVRGRQVGNQSGGGGGGGAQQGPVRMGVDSQGRLVAGVAPFDSMQALYVTEGALRQRLKVKGLGGVELATRLKNFQL